MKITKKVARIFDCDVLIQFDPCLTEKENEIKIAKMEEVIKDIFDNWKPYKSTGTITNPPKQWSE